MGYAIAFTERKTQMSKQWHYAQGTNRQGPVPEEQLINLLRAGAVKSTDLVWSDGMSNWVPAATVPALVSSASGPPPLVLEPNVPPVMMAQVAQSKGTAVIVLTVLAGFFSIFIGGCTGAAAEGVASFGENMGEFQSKYGSHYDSFKTRREAEAIRKTGSGFVAMGLLQAVLGVAGGIYAFRKYNDPSTIQIAGRTFTRLMLAGVLILVAAALTITNLFAFITAGVMNAIAGLLTILQAKSLPR